MLSDDGHEEPQPKKIVVMADNGQACAFDENGVCIGISDCFPGIPGLVDLALTVGLISNEVRQATSLRLVNGRRFRVTSEALMAVAEKLLPKLGPLGRARRKTGFGMG